MTIRSEAAAAISVRLGGTGTATAAQPTLAQALSNSSIDTSEPAPLAPSESVASTDSRLVAGGWPD